MIQILFASQNKNKQNEARALFNDLGLQLVFLDQLLDKFPDLSTFDPEETGNTFSQNALIKAKAYAQKTNLACIADDSGIEIDGLDGLPGVKSNRWFEGTADDRNAEVLKRLSPEKPRTARYIASACFYDPQTEEYIICDGSIEGKIATEIIPGEGFDYDRIFIPIGYDKTYSQLGQEIKNNTSHRAIAYKQLHDFLKDKLSLNITQ